MELNRLISRRLIGLIVVVAVIIVGWLVYQNSYFRVAGTEPKTSRVASVSPFLKIHFNRQLSNQQLSVSASPNVIASYNLDGKILVIDLKIPMDTQQTYSISINKIMDMKGDTITNKVISFQPKNIASQDLSSAQKQALLQQQTYHPPSKTNIGYVGFDTLAKYGPTTAQLADLQKAFFKFAPNAKKITLDTSSIKPAPHDPNSASTTSTINFGVTVDNTTYQAKIDYFNLTSLDLHLYDVGTGGQLFDSGEVDSTSQ